MVTSDPKFWNGKVKHDFVDIDFDIIPDFLYKFKESDGYGIYISNYRKLYQSYIHALKRFNMLNEEHIDVVRPLSSISNFKALYLFEQNYLDNWKIYEILKLYQYELYLPVNPQIGYRVVEISVGIIHSGLYTIKIEPNDGREIISYTVDYYRAFNLILNTCINGWD